MLFGVKVRRYYHASTRSSEIDGKKQRDLFFFSERSRGRPIPYDLEPRFRILRAIVVNLFSEMRDASGGEGNRFVPIISRCRDDPPRARDRRDEPVVRVPVREG